MGDAQQGGPLAGRGSRAQVVTGLVDERPDVGGRLGLHVGRVVVTQGREQRLLVGEARSEGVGVNVHAGHSPLPSSSRNPSASRTVTPSSSALASFEPAPGPATT